MRTSQRKDAEAAAAAAELRLTSLSSGSDTGPLEHPGNGITASATDGHPLFPVHERAPSGILTVVLILPLSVLMQSRWCRLAKGLAAPQDSR